MPFVVEHGGIQVGVGFLFGQAEQGHLVIAGIDARDRVLAALGDPGRSVRADDHAMRRGALAEIHEFVGAIAGI